MKLIALSVPILVSFQEFDPGRVTSQRSQQAFTITARVNQMSDLEPRTDEERAAAKLWDIKEYQFLPPGKVLAPGVVGRAPIVDEAAPSGDPLGVSADDLLRMHICPNTFLRAHPTKWQVFLTASKRATFTRITLEVDEWIHPTAGDTSVTISRPGGVAEVAGRSTGLYFTGPLVVFDRPAFIYLERNPPAAGLTVADVMPVVVPNTVDASRDSRDTEVLSARFRAVAQRCR